MANKETTELIKKCIKHYIDSVTEGGTKCPSIEEMKEIIKLDDIINSISNQ